MAGDEAQAQKVADDLTASLPDDTIVKFIYVPTIQAAGAVHQGNGGKAIEYLQVTAPYDLSSNLRLTLGISARRRVSTAEGRRGGRGRISEDTE